MRDGPSDLTNTDDLRRLMRRSAVAYLLGSSAYIFEMPGAGQQDQQGYVLRSATARLSASPSRAPWRVASSYGRIPKALGPRVRVRCASWIHSTSSGRVSRGSMISSA